MGMDVCGLNSTSEEGEYFYANIATWGPIAAFCLTVAPEECKPCGSWFTNDGDGLDADDSARLAQRLEAALVDGSLERCVPPVQHEDTLFPAFDYRSYLKEITPAFIAFLRTCGGFAIW